MKLLHTESKQHWTFHCLDRKTVKHWRTAESQSAQRIRHQHIQTARRKWPSAARDGPLSSAHSFKWTWSSVHIWIEQNEHASERNQSRRCKWAEPMTSALEINNAHDATLLPDELSCSSFYFLFTHDDIGFLFTLMIKSHTGSQGPESSERQTDLNLNNDSIV